MKPQNRHILLGLVLCTANGVLAISPENNIVCRTYLDSTGSDAASRVTTCYYDGMGRERLKVENAAGGDCGDFAIRTDYDTRGNVSKVWQPLPGGVELLDNRLYDRTVSSFWGNGEIAYTKYTYEDARTNRVCDLSGPGVKWQGHSASTSWSKNEQVGDYACILLTADDDGSVTARGMYGPNTLSVEIVTNEDGMRTLSFVNRSDNKVLVRRIGRDGTVADTRYIYDVRGDLRCVLSPEGSRLLPLSGSVGDDIIDQFAQRYDYDLWHRCISTKAPGCGPVHYVYDRLGAVIFESTAEGRLSGEWTMTKYDKRHRPAIKGLVTIKAATRESLQQTYGDSLIVATFTPDFNYAEGSMLYSRTGGPNGFKPYMAWFYDNYDFIVGPATAHKADFETAQADGYTQQGLCTGIAMSDGNLTWYTATKYDHRNLVLRQYSWDANMQSQRHKLDFRYDFAGNEILREEAVETLSETLVTKVHTATTHTEYDKRGRVLRRTLSVDNNPEITLAQYAYDALGRLSSDHGAITTEYDYDIRSNLTGIRSERFSQTAWYGHAPQGVTSPSFIGINALRSMWADGQDASGFCVKSESFAYDDLGRYKSSTTDDGEIKEEIEVDLDANVTQIKRVFRGDKIQDAALMYESGKVTSVYDSSSPYWVSHAGRFPAGNYELTYDSDGRLKSDGTRSVSDISYHSFGNLPLRISMANGDYIINTYMPDGTLKSRQFATKTVRTVTKITAAGDTIVKTYPDTKRLLYTYVGNFENSHHGLIYNTEAGYYQLSSKKHYWYLRDRLGSTVAVVDSMGDFCQTTAYYPSGTPHRLNADAIATDITESTDHLHIGNRWLGHSGLNCYDNTARLHDPLLMRFATPDPLYGKYPDLSPWSHCAANPLSIIDPNGKDVYIVDNKGYVTIIEDKDRDVIRAADPETQKNHPDLELPYGTIIKSKDFKWTEPIPSTMLQVRGDENGKKIFEFLAGSTNVEWVHIKTGIEGDKGLNFISTSHDESGDLSGGQLIVCQLRYGYTVREHIHSHPLNTSYPSDTDSGFAILIRQILNQNPNFFIYTPENKQYIQYSL